ncbi:MAG: PEP-CTERM sorting domain-containing protein [Chloroherpetonaceae bacterium]|nr:PEP-CTERM sorting domain-containing protein [Chthonomonadaceae bacterium]MDW8206506.1 PEP-CTERM sorting domain-containing protein [Chloroherpetonaceae bacterium]
MRPGVRLRLLLLTGLILLAWTPSVRAELRFIDRYTRYDITFPGGYSGALTDFTGAVASYYVQVFGRADAVGDTFNVLISVKQLYYDFFLNTVGGIRVISDVWSTPTLYDVVFEAFDPNNLAGFYEFGYRTPTVPVFDTSGFGNSFIRLTDGGSGNQALRFLGEGRGLIPFDPDTRYLTEVFIEGDWSSLGTDPGQLRFDGINPAWQILDFFTYDPFTNTTRFVAVAAPYTDEAFNPSIDFTLFSARPLPTQVPEPGPWALLAGAATLACLLRVRRR